MVTNETYERGYGLAVEPRVEDYALALIDEAFDWPTIIGQVAEKRAPAGPEGYYLVVFRSQLKEDADRIRLQSHDMLAHDAALESPDLLHYFAGEADEAGRAMSWCLWSDRNTARQISRDPRHLAATQMVDQYDSYSLERYAVQPGDSIVIMTDLQTRCPIPVV